MSLIKESIDDSEDYSEEVSHSFDAMSVNTIAKGMKTANLSYDLPVKFVSEGHHMSVKSVLYVEPESGAPYILLDI